MELRDLFKNQDATEFCIVTIPTQLAIAESKRLLEALNTQGIAVRNIVVNQVRMSNRRSTVAGGVEGKFRERRERERGGVRRGRSQRVLARSRQEAKRPALLVRCCASLVFALLNHC